MVYLIRTTPPNKVFSESFDRRVRACFESIIGSPTNDISWLQCTLSSRFGGMGLRMTQTHCSAGFIASYLIYKNSIANSSVHPLLETASKIYKTKSNQEIPDSTVIEQKKLSEDIDRKTFTYIFERLDDQGKAHLLSASGDFATAWTTLLPSPSWLMKKVEFITASKFLLGMKLYALNA